MSCFCLVVIAKVMNLCNQPKVANMLSSEKLFFY